MNKEQILGIIRHVLTAIGAILALKGYTDDTTVTTVIGALMTTIGGIWSIIDKSDNNILAKANTIMSKKVK